MSSDFHLGNPGLFPQDPLIFLYNKRYLSGKFKIVSQPEPGPTKMTKSWYDNSTLVLAGNSTLPLIGALKVQFLTLRNSYAS